MRISQIHRSLCIITKESDLLLKPEPLHSGLTPWVLPENVAAICGIYVDDYLIAGPKTIIDPFLAHLRSIWKTSEPLYLEPGVNFSFLGITLEITPLGILLHQRAYTEALIDEFKEVTPTRKRTTTGEPEHFSQLPPSPPDMTNADHICWVKRAQKILGALLWLSTRTRPDISCAVSLAAQCLWHNLQDLKVRIKHLLQYLSTTRTFGLLYLHPQNSTQSSSLTEFAVFSDASFAPSGKGSQSGYCVMLTYGTVRHLVHWHSTREKKVAESSAESELYALSTAFKAGRNFRLLVQEFLTTDLLLSLRCDNKATIAMLEEPSWRTRYLSIYGESLRSEMEDRTCLLTYVSTELQLADPLTKPTSSKINDILLPLWGMISCEANLMKLLLSPILATDSSPLIMHSSAVHMRIAGMREA